MKEGVRRICDKKDFTIQEKRRLENQVFQIWKRYILKIKKLNLNIGGIFKKYIFSKNKKPEQQSKNNIQKIQDEQLNSQQKNELKSQERLTQIPLKRQRKRRSKKQQLLTGIIIDPKSHFRSYYLISVKPLIPQSQQQRKNDKKCLTKCQKHFLSYLLQQKEVDDQFLQLISNKYIKMLQILRKQKNDAYLKQKQILYELKLRNRNLQEKKYNSLLLILLVDIIICLSLSSVHLQQTINLAQLLEFYKSSSYNNYFINTILNQLGQEQQKDDHNIPIINYQLIYSIIYLGCLRGGKCITISEVLHNCGVLEIQQIVYSQGKQDVILPPVYNQEHLSCPKIRRNSHLLKAFLSIDIKLFPLKWSHKWCLKFKIQHHLKQIQYLNNMLLRQESLNKQKIGFNLHQQMQNDGKTIKYVRCIELQQDIACLAGIIVYLKLTNGLNLYPYLINFITNPKFQSLCQQTQIDNINFSKTLLQNKKIFIKNPQDNLFIQKYLPHPYQHQLNINLPQLSETLAKIRLTDKEYNISMLNKNLLKIVNLADLNYLSSNQILTYLARLKRTKLGGEDSQYELTLRYNSNSFKGFCREGKIGVKKHKNDGILCEKSNKLKLNKHLIRQIEVIKKQQQQWKPYNIPSEDNTKQRCLLDYPSSNYQIILEYTNDNLILSQRQSQLHIIQLFCLNLCSYNQLTNWLSKYQSILKEYQI